MADDGIYRPSIQYSASLLIFDSVAADYRAEFDSSRQQSSHMGAQSAEVVVGMQLHNLAAHYSLAIVVANQVSDRFTNSLALCSDRKMHQQQHTG